MSYGIKYQLLMKSHLAATQYTAKIYKKDYAGSEVDRNVPLSPFILKKDKAKWVRGTSLQVSIREESDFEFLEFYTNDPKEFQVEYLVATTVIWKGYIVPQQYQVPYTPAPTNVTLLATDGLGLLKNEMFTLTGRNSELTKIRHCVDKIGLGLGFAIAITVRPDGQATNRAVLDQVYDDCEIYSGKTCYEVLEDILQKYDADITQVNGRWHIIRSTDRKSTRMLYTSAGVYETTQAAPTVLDLKNAIAAATDVRPVGALSFELQAGGKQVTITHDYGRKDSFLSNATFTEYAAGVFTDWSNPDSLTLEQRDLDGKKYVFIDGNQATDKYIEQTIPIENVTGQSFVFSILAAAFGYNSYGGIRISNLIDVVMVVFVTDGVDTYYLKKDNVWGAVNDAWSILVSENSSIGAPEFNEIRVVTDEIPISGTLHVRLYATKMTVFGDNVYEGVAFADCFAYFLNDGQKYESSVAVTAVFDNSTEPNILDNINLLAGGAPGLANEDYLYQNIIRISDGTAAGDWSRDGVGGTYTLNQLIAKTLASNNRCARQVLKGTLRGDIDFDSVIKHAYNSDREFEISECEWDPYLETFKVTLTELLSWSDEAVTYTEVVSLAGSANTGASSSGGVVGIRGDQGYQGNQGNQGDQGDQGPQGTQGQQGTVGAGMEWQGSWQNDFNYLVGHAVYHEGASYICTAANINQEPPNLSYWDVIAEGSQGTQGPQGNDGADAVAGKLPSSYVELSSPVGTTSATFEDVSGMSTTITLDETVEIACFASFECATQSGASASTIEVCFNINGTDHDPHERYLSGSNDKGIGALVHRSGDLAAGTYTVKLRFRRTSGVATPGLNRADMLVMAMQGAKGEQGDQGSQGPQGPFGSQGAQGDQGYQGVQGDMGDQGPQGLQGATGEGIEGPMGPQGNQGDQGASGPAGPQGFQGYQGNQGPQGDQGSQGHQGNQGTQGLTGAGIEWQGSWQNDFNYLVGHGVTHNGSSYVATLGGINHEPPNLSYWDLLAEAGTDGTNGSQGPQGYQGYQGASGAEGAQGPQGDPGSNTMDVLQLNPSGAPGSPSDGMIYYNDSDYHFYGRSNGSWVRLDNA